MNLFFSIITCFVVSIYNIQFNDVKGDALSMNTFRGKRLLLVNIATGSSRADQLGELQQLKLLYGDSLEIIAFPSNSFGHENRTDSEINQFCRSKYGATYLLAARNAVTGATRQAIYGWLSQKVENGAVDGELTEDYQKYLIDREGQIAGIFAGCVSPLDSLIINAINQN